MQIVEDDIEFRMDLIDLRELAKTRRESEVHTLISDEAKTAFDLSRLPLLRTKLLRLTATESVLILTIHHIVSDGWSMSLLWEEFLTHYLAFSQKRLPKLADLPIQYPDYARWQRESLAAGRLAAQLKYWRNQLKGIQQLDLPTDRPRPAILSFRGATLQVRLSRHLSTSARLFAREQKVTLHNLLFFFRR